MFIQTQSTPNPSSLMFYPGKPVMEVGSADFPNVRSALGSPLAKSIYSIDGIFVICLLEKDSVFQCASFLQVWFEFSLGLISSL